MTNPKLPARSAPDQVRTRRGPAATGPEWSCLTLLRRAGSQRLRGGHVRREPSTGSAGSRDSCLRCTRRSRSTLHPSACGRSRVIRRSSRGGWPCLPALVRTATGAHASPSTALSCGSESSSATRPSATTSARSPSPRCRCAPIARSSPFTGAAVSLTSAGAPRFVALDAETAVKLDRTFAQVYRDGLESLRALVEGRARTIERAGRRRPLSRGPRRAASLGVASARAARSPHARICTGPQKATWLRILRIHGNGWRYVQAAPRSSLPSTLTL